MSHRSALRVVFSLARDSKIVEEKVKNALTLVDRLGPEVVRNPPNVVHTLLMSGTDEFLGSFLKFSTKSFILTTQEKDEKDSARDISLAL